MGNGPKGKNLGRRERTEQEKAQDLADISRLYLDGLTQRAIVQWIKEHRAYVLSLNTVNLDIQRTLALWKEQAVANIDEIKARDLAKLADVEARATAAYELSLSETVKTINDKRTRGKGKPSENLKSVTKETRNGDPRFLMIILECIRERKEILGYAKPKKFEFDPDKDKDAKPELETDVLSALAKAYGSSINVESSVQTVSQPQAQTQTATTVPDWRLQVAK